MAELRRLLGSIATVGDALAESFSASLLTELLEGRTLADPRRAGPSDVECLHSRRATPRLQWRAQPVENTTRHTDLIRAA